MALKPAVKDVLDEGWVVDQDLQENGLGEYSQQKDTEHQAGAILL